jgi:phosphohistidine phosphatase SixA
MKRVALAAVTIWLLAVSVAAADDSQEAWTALVNGGHVALIRHGNAPPGHGDPPGFKIDDCSTQRNLDEKGRAQARALGEAFRHHGVRADKIVSSPWCRCLETARLMVLGPVDGTWTVAASDKSPERLAALKQMLANWRGPGTLVVVTHALTVQALVGIMPGQADRGDQTQAWQGAGRRGGGQDPRARVMDRRAFLATVAGGLLAAPLAAEAIVTEAQGDRCRRSVRSRHAP